MTDPLFGEYGPDAPLPATAPVTDALEVGCSVVVLAGRLARAAAVVVELTDVPTPAGFRASVARIRRPRAGESWELTTNLRRVG